MSGRLEYMNYIDMLQRVMPSGYLYTGVKTLKDLELILKKIRKVVNLNSIYADGIVDGLGFVNNEGILGVEGKYIEKFRNLVGGESIIDFCGDLLNEGYEIDVEKVDSAYGFSEILEDSKDYTDGLRDLVETGLLDSEDAQELDVEEDDKLFMSTMSEEDEDYEYMNNLSNIGKGIFESDAEDSDNFLNIMDEEEEDYESIIESRATMDVDSTEEDDIFMHTMEEEDEEYVKETYEESSGYEEDDDDFLEIMDEDDSEYEEDFGDDVDIARFKGIPFEEDATIVNKNDDYVDGLSSDHIALAKGIVGFSEVLKKSPKVAKKVQEVSKKVYTELKVEEDE